MQFLAGLEGDSKLLEEIDYALKHPVFLIFGRAPRTPEGKLSLGYAKNSLLMLYKRAMASKRLMNRKAQSSDPLVLQ